MIAVLSDVHGNLEALEAVLATLDGSDRVICLGDLVGYGPSPNECIERLRARATTTILGNHDVAAIDDFGLEFFAPSAREAIVWTQSVLTEENAAWLAALAYEVRMPEYLLVHGAPVTYFAYVFDKDAAARAFAETDARLIFIGHTHVAETYVLSPDGSIEHRHFQHDGEMRLEPDRRYLINVGSVGQPRDLNPDACFVRYDPDGECIAFRRVAYDVASVRAKIDAVGLPRLLAERLAQGR